MQIESEGTQARLERLAHIELGVRASNFQGPCNYGQFGPTVPEVKAQTGQEFYNAEFIFKEGRLKTYAVIEESGKSFTMIGFYKDCETYQWISKEDLLKYLDSCDPADSPSTFYPIQPSNQGKFLWFTGTGGAGKTTSAFLFAKHHGYVYFEADCFLLHTNPYVPLDAVSSAGAFFKQPPLKGIDRKRVDGCIQGDNFYANLAKGIDEEAHQRASAFYQVMAQYVKDERQRIGGDWAVAQAVPTRALRDEIKKILPDVTFVTLTLKEDVLRKRLEARHGKDQKGIADHFVSYMKQFEPATEDETQAFNIDLTVSMTPDDVVQLVLQKLKQ